MAESVNNREYEAISLELQDMKERINQLASLIGQDIRSLTERNLKDLTLTGLAENYPNSQITAEDSGVTALGKLQRQIKNVDEGVANIDYSQALQELLVGFSVSEELEDIRNDDNILTAFGKAQKYLQTLNQRVETIEQSSGSVDIDYSQASLENLTNMVDDAFWKARYVEDNYTEASTQEIWWNDNANNRTWAGIHYAPEDWRGSVARNFPTEAAGILKVLKHSDYVLVIQEYTTYVSLERWIRSFDGTTWTPWKQIVT